MITAGPRLRHRVFTIRAEAQMIRSWAVRRVHSQYRQSALRLFWSVLQPVSMIAVYAVVFQQILRVDGNGLPYLSFLVTGLTVWRFFANGLNQATAIVDFGETRKKIYLRAEILPISGCVAGFVDLAIGTVACVVIAAIQGLPIGASALAVPLIYVPLVLYTVAVAVLLATLTVFVRDISHAMPTIQQLLFLATPIMYSTRQIPENLTFLVHANPIAALAEEARTALLRGLWPDWTTVGVHTVVATAVLAAAIAYTRSIEDRVVDVA